MDVVALAMRNAMRVILTSRATEQELLERFGLLNEAYLTTELTAAVIASFLAWCVGAPLACWILWRRKENRGWLICYVLTCFYVIGLASPVAGYDRYRLPIQGILWILFAAFLVELRRNFPSRPRGRRWAVAARSKSRTGQLSQI